MNLKKIPMIITLFALLFSANGFAASCMQHAWVMAADRYRACVSVSGKDGRIEYLGKKEAGYLFEYDGSVKVRFLINVRETEDSTAKNCKYKYVSMREYIADENGSWSPMEPCVQ